MKQIITYINEKLRLTAKRQYTCQPKNWDELREIIKQRIEDEGHDCDLNDIDISKITDMSSLFSALGTVRENQLFKDFNGDISQWDVSNVRNMRGMFYKCAKFDCDLSKWNVSNVHGMDSMFHECEKFNCDLSKWDVSNVTDMYGMFYGCKKFDCNLSAWDVSNVEKMSAMFYGCEKFRQDLNSWNVSNVKYIHYAFKNCPTHPKWYNE